MWASNTDKGTLLRVPVTSSGTPGPVQVVLTAADGLDSPTDTAVRGTRLFVTDGAFATPHDAQLQEGRINLAALLGR